MKLRSMHLIVQIETAGVRWREGMQDAEIVVSPKTAVVDASIAASAVAWKYPLEVGNTDPLDGLPVFTPHGQEAQVRHATYRPPPGTHTRQIFVTPIDSGDEKINAANRAHVAAIAMKYGYTAQVQLHKFLNVE